MPLYRSVYSHGNEHHIYPLFFFSFFLIFHPSQFGMCVCVFSIEFVSFVRTYMIVTEDVCVCIKVFTFFFRYKKLTVLKKILIAISKYLLDYKKLTFRKCFTFIENQFINQKKLLFFIKGLNYCLRSIIELITINSDINEAYQIQSTFNSLLKYSRNF